MSGWLRSAVVPVYVLLCIVLGGSAQGIWQNAVLQLLAVPIIAWPLLTKSPAPITAAGMTLFAIVGAAILLTLAQLVPLPPSLWTALPGRDFVASGYSLLDQPLPWLPLSLTPYHTMATALTLLPPLAVLAAMLLAGAYRPSWLACAILIGTFTAVLLGALQVGSGNPANSPWYLYSRTNYGSATGFFANSNHMAALLVISVPILFALVRGLRDRLENAKASSAILLLAVAGVLVLLVGIAINQSLAILLIGPPVLLISALMLLPKRMSWRRPLWGLALVGAGAMIVIYTTPLYDRVAGSHDTSLTERQTMWSITARAVADYMPVGSGISSFRDIYPHYEDPLTVNLTVVNHAHNDYLELALETGAPGILLVVAFVFWWLARSRAVWRMPLSDRYAQAATVATAALLLHSIVDYPLRTTSLSAIMAACVALMAPTRTRQRNANADLWPTRHATI